MEKQNSQHILEALEIADELMVLADNELILQEDESCSTLSAIMRDCAYSIRHYAATKHKIIRTKTKDGEAVWKKQQSEGISLKKAVIVLLVLALSLSAQVAQAAYVDVVDALSPLGYWRLGESSGTIAADRAGSYNGTYGGGVTLGATGALGGDSDTAVSFDGNNDILTTAASVDLLLTGDLSISFWFNAASFPSSSNTDPLFTLSANAATSGSAKLAELAIDENGDIVYTHEYGDQGSNEETYTFSTANLDTDTWYNIALIRDSSAKDVDLYIDNSLLDTYSYTTGPEGYTAGTLSVGGYGGRMFEGTIDEFAVFGSQLSGQDVNDIYNAAQVPEPATVILLGLGMLCLRKRRHFREGCHQEICPR